ncbi:MAG: hypothetical protein IJ318_03580 [Clostridia bacterium]|nr:hypothetical protein [Clostridia bacterium]
MENSNNVLLSQVSYSRNIKDMPFVKTLTDTEQAVGVVRSMSEIFGDDFEFRSLKNMQIEDCLRLEEKGQLTRLLIDNKDISAFGKTDDLQNFIFINEQEHVRIVARIKGFNLEMAYQKANEIDDKLSDKLELAFDTTFGYLTANPNLCGTGMQITCLLFLPAIMQNDKFAKLKQESLLKDYLLTDLNGKEHDGKSAFVVIKNKYTFGYKESEFAEQMQRTVQKLLEIEQREENNIFDFSASNLVDKIFRAYGIAKNAYRITQDCALECLATILWGLNLKVLKLKNQFDILSVLCKIKENHLNSTESNIKELEKARAKVLASIIEKAVLKGEVDV